MLDARFVSEHPDTVRDHLSRRCADPSLLASVDRISALAAHRREQIAERDALRAQRNTLSKQIGALMKSGQRDEAEKVKTTVQNGNERIKDLEAQMAEAGVEERALLMALPNLLSDDVPTGADEEANVEVRSWGTPRTFDFDPQPHVEVGERLGIIDLEAAIRLTGARFSVLKGHGARLERALVNFFLDLHTSENGFTEVMVPYIVHREVLEGTGQLPKFEEDLFRLSAPLNGQDAFLIPTAEVPVTNLHRGQIVEHARLPLKFTAFTPCFRAEAGSAGRDVRGLIRQHQFHKVELVTICAPEQAAEAHAHMVASAETVLQRLELPYRVMLLSSGDIGFGASKCYDLEVWLPSQQRFREISSISHCGDFQARRMSLRYRPASEGSKKAKPKLAHTLNGSGLAVGRTLVAILENGQQEDGSVVIPEVLRPYMGGLDRIVPPTS